MPGDTPLSAAHLRHLLTRSDGRHRDAASQIAAWLDAQSGPATPAATTAVPAPALAATPPRPVRLTIGMAVHDDFDGVYFTAQAIRLFHAEVAADTEILVVDNDPHGPAAASLKSLASWIPGYRYVPYDRWKSTAVRDVVFREAAGAFVLCIDSHVLLAPGSIRRLLDYLDAHPTTDDLLQGPMLYDDGRSVASHMDPVWREGMLGTWSTDPRANDPGGPPFEIPMHGLGLFGCRRQAWPGFNPRFLSFGGEEGYLHEKFRRLGRRTLCLPFLRWLHRFHRPRPGTYVNRWEDRVRNYVIGFKEVGLDVAPIRDHFAAHLGAEPGRRVFDQAMTDASNPFDVFDGIYLINLETEPRRLAEMKRRFEALGIDWRVRRMPAVATPRNHHVGCALSHRMVIEEARRLGLRNVLVFEDDCLFLDDTLARLAETAGEIASLEWSLLYLGAHRQARPPSAVPGARQLVRPDCWTCTHAMAYAERGYARLLEAIPSTPEAMIAWLAREHGVDQFFANRWSDEALAFSPSIVTQRSILDQEDEALRERYL